VSDADYDVIVFGGDDIDGGQQLLGS